MARDINESILSAIGHTPLVRLKSVIEELHFNLYAKLEGFNPGGSTKDRPAITIIDNAMERGLVNRDTIVIESSSGNMGVGLAQACAYYGLRFICVVDPKTTLQNLLLMKAYGAELDLVKDPDPVTGEYLQARIDRVRALCRTLKNTFWPNQYSNLCNPLAHHQTMREIVYALKGRVDNLFCATSTCGTLRGCVEYVREHDLGARVFAVDATGSVIFGGPKSKRLIPGHGAAVRPQLFIPDLAEQCIHVSDLDCIVGCRRLVRTEAILSGGSSGAVVMAVDQVKHLISGGANCVMIFPDRGERYLDTIYSDEWVEKHFGDVSHLWQKLPADAASTMLTKVS